MKLFKQHVIFIGTLCLLLQTTVQGQEVKMYSQPPSAEEMGKIIFGGGPKMRSINFGKPLAPKTDVKSPLSNQEQPPETLASIVGLPIKFGYNSDEILEESVPFLQEVGKMLTLEEYLSKRLVIEGHTDAIGSDQYNQVLSQRRANKVKHYLRRNFHITASRLLTKGLGESTPLPGYSPEDEVNRRVQFYSM